MLDVQRVTEYLNASKVSRFLPNLLLLSSRTSTTATPPKPDPVRVERTMGDTEASYFLPSRESGVNDMLAPPC